jgi:hypothetical protein
MKRSLKSMKHARYVLPTESAEDLETEYLALESAIRPRDKIEEMHLEDIAYHQRKLLERRRFEFAIFKTALSEALFDLLVHRLGALNTESALILVERWTRGDPAAKAEVHDILQSFGHDETTIEAEAYLRCSTKLTAVQQSEAAHALRRDKALPNLAFYREMVLHQRQMNAKRARNGDKVPRLEEVREREQSRGH